LDAQPRRATSGVDRAQRWLDVLLDLDMDGHRVAAGLEELVDELPGVRDHEMRVEGQAGAAPKRLDRLRAEGQVRDEVAVHHVEVDPVGPFALCSGDRMGEVAEIGVEDARRDAGARRRGRLREARDGAPLHASTPAGTGSSLRWPRRARALAVSSRRRRRATAGAAGAPARSAASWPQAAPISTPRLRRIVTGIPAAFRRAANR